MAAAASGPGDFFARQDDARGATRRLVVLYLLAVAAVVVASDLALSFIFQLGSRHTETLPPVFHLAIGGGVLLVIAVGALMQWFELRGDAGETVAARLGGRRVAPGSQDQRERRLLNVVEEMALAAGLPVPAVYVLEGEGAINAFAAGWSSDRASVAVTRGALDTLTRDELQGVVAHELSHVLNGDMALNLRLMCGQHGLLALTEVGRLLMRTRGRKNPLPLAGLALWLLGWIGWAGAALLRAAVNRRREHLADAAAVQFTRNPHGLASALRKIGGSATGAGLAHPGAAAASHLLFAGDEGWSAWTSTHPPLAERIRLLDPAWDGRFPAVLPTIATSPPPPPLPVAGLAPARPATAPQAARAAALPTPGQVRFATTTIAA
ncbi:MAG: M48 family metalloprotease, partial [Planctomycetes bacterium]|nr:M48 family metalloprotease [Planctomycetota bacterium]